MQSVSMPQTVSNEQLFAKLCEVQALLEAQQKEDKRGLWGLKEVTEYSGFTTAHVCRSIVADPRFPAPVDIQGRLGKAARVWLKKEVIAFFERNKVRKVRV